MEQMLIQTVADAKKCLGQKVYWDDASNRYVFLRSGVLEAVNGRNLTIDGNEQWLPNLKDRKFRNYEEGGAWAKASSPQPTIQDQTNESP